MIANGSRIRFENKNRTELQLKELNDGFSVKKSGILNPSEDSLRNGRAWE